MSDPKMLPTVFKSLLHGDADRQRWLSEAIDASVKRRDALSSHLAKANAANSSADLISQAVAGHRFATEIQAIKAERDAALAERDTLRAALEYIIEIADLAALLAGRALAGKDE